MLNNVKCPHCNQEHPNNFQFCPIKGLPISYMKACNNPNCRSYDQYILPKDAYFCPECGHPIEGKEEESPNKLEFLVNEVSFTMIRVEHGDFLMGSNDACSYEDSTPTHKVTLTCDYYMGETLVTQALWNAVMSNNPSHFGKRNDACKKNDRKLLPVESVSWDDCQLFIKKLNVLTGKEFRLPTEAEWEFAARGGKKSHGYYFAGGDFLSKVGNNYDGDDDGHTLPVAMYAPNELGFYDMSGNVGEWCNDWCESYNENSQIDPQGPLNGTQRIFRGGHWNEDYEYCGVASRDSDVPQVRENTIGFRLALSNL